MEDLFRGAVWLQLTLDGQQLLTVGGGVLVAALHDGVDGLRGEAEGAEVVDLGMDVQVAKLAVLLVVTPDHDVLELANELGQRLQLVHIVDHAPRHLDADDDVSPHLTADVGGEVVDKPAIDKALPVDGDGGEDAWDGHAGTDGLRKLALTDHHGIARGDVGGHAGEGDGQLVEVDGVLIADAKAVEEVQQVVAGDERTRQRADERAGLGTCYGRNGLGSGDPVSFVLFDTLALDLVDELAGVEGDGDQIGAAPVLVGRRDVAPVHVVAHVFRPVHPGDELLQLLGRIAQGIQPPDDGTHAGAYDVIDGQADLLDVFQHPYVGGAFGAATAQHDADLRPWRPDGVTCHLRGVTRE